MSKSLFWLVSIVGFSFLSISAADMLGQIRQKILDDHNKYRKQHHVPPLQLNDTLSTFAQEWSDELLNTGKLKHRPANKLGENLWTGTGFTLDDMLTNEKANPVDSWYAEIKNYPHESFEKWGHFTQLIWKNTKYLGCGISSDANVIFVVCNYDPAGNWRKRYHENVFTVDGLPWSNETAQDNSTFSQSGAGKVGGGGKARENKKADDAPDSSSLILIEDREGSPPFWMYGLGFLVILMVVVFLAILVYYQKS